MKGADESTSLDDFHLAFKDSSNQSTKQIASEKNLKIDHSGHLISHPVDGTDFKVERNTFATWWELHADTECSLIKSEKSKSLY